jgi:methionyl-tRNA synthetase
MLAYRGLIKHVADARGDQCDRCGTYFQTSKKLIEPHCKIDKTAPVWEKREHMFLQLDKLQPKIEKWFEKSSAAGWSANGIAITRSWLDKGLGTRSITRDLSWGVPVPLPDIPNYKNKVIYVWFDACIGYPSITANYTDEWEQWWKNPENVTLYQFMGKDNVPFHSVVFPGSEIGTGEDWTLVNNISTTEYLNYETGKFSKSRGVGVFGDTAKLTGVPPSVWRYYLLANRPEVSDTEFKWADFVAANNNELLANFGNFINRVVKFTVANFDSTVPEFDPTYEEPATTENTLDFRVWLADVQTLLTEYNEELESVHLRAGTDKLMAISSKGNLLLQKRVDNANLAAHPQRTKTVVGLALNLCSLLASLCAPYMPSTATSIAEQLGSTVQFIPDTWDPTFLKPGHKIGKPAYLFASIDEKMVEEWKEKYGGTQADREKQAEEARLKLEKKEMEKERRKAKQDAARAEAEKNEALKKDVEEKEEKSTAEMTPEQKEKLEKRKQERDRKKAIKDAAKAKKAGEKTDGAQGEKPSSTENKDALPVRAKDESVEK